MSPPANRRRPFSFSHLPPPRPPRLPVDQRARAVLGDSVMGLWETIIGFAAFGSLLVVGVVQDRRPYAPGRLNWVPAMMIGLIGAIVFAIHLAALLRH